MESIQIKSKFKKKKKIITLLNHISAMDETVIKINGNRNDSFFSVIQNAFEKSLAGESDLCNEILSMQGLSGRKFRILINEIIKNFDKPRYLEIGSWLGSSVCSASYNNKLEIICIDNWSQNFGLDLNPREIFLKNVEKYISKKNKFTIIEKNFKSIDYSSLRNFNIYFYDGGHHYQDHYDAIYRVLPALSDKFILIIDDWNWKQVREGTMDSIKKEKLKILSSLEIKTTNDNSSSLVTGECSDWHQGCAFFVLKK